MKMMIDAKGRRRTAAGWRLMTRWEKEGRVAVCVDEEGE